MISQRTTNRIIFFERLLLFLTTVRDRLSYTMDDASQILKSDEKMLSGMLEVMRESTPRLGAKEAAKMAVGSIPRSYGLKLEDKKTVYDFLSGFGSFDCDGEISHCEMYISVVNRILSSQREEAAKKSRLYKLLGTFSGIGAGLFFMLI